MSKPKLLYYDILNYTYENNKLLHDRFDVVSLPNPDHDTPEVLASIEAVLTPLGWLFGVDKIDSCPHLRAIGSNTTGHPHIDVDHAAERGIRVITLKAYQEFLDTITPTAEMTIGLMVALTRNLVPAIRSVTDDGRWERWPFGGQRMLSRMSLGLVGIGRLGRMTAVYADCIGMAVRFYDPYVEGEGEFQKVDTLTELVAESDIVSLHAPHEAETENMINAEVFSHFKPGSFFINTARGELVDEDALLAALESGRLAGAAVDVLNGEFVPRFGSRVLEHPLVRYATEHDNLLITPHIGGSTRDAWGLTQEFVIRRMIECFEKIDHA